MSALLVDPQSDSLIGEATMKFFGKFIPVRRVAQSLRLPDGTHPQATETYAQSSGVWTRGRKIFGIRLVTSNNSNTPLEQGKPYFIEGQITGSTFLKVPKFTWVAGDERVSNIGLHYSEWERVAEATVSFASILVTDSESSSSELNNDF
ncbi:hypothetical protein PtA15_2A823 [Puccinia triticina]|uniref:Uncharacterized protein n=1 Tax=Puccinia triticina TaxID=208348 RepID=A0ABY7CBD1_9BASI|nr:uncharacterized protein PtA15_2A823 [Puccinia triticina]WAQ82506.1 hypothetical protein PtA15_2A823 [Puccinia triticina]